mmetsp:Transcript_13084/g.27666  ORF Transcript_13084/g.27666 Transcript_13084/m.27666 type:complete len:259 (-) Transcript_13084:228-1004(-)
MQAVGRPKTAGAIKVPDREGDKGRLRFRCGGGCRPGLEPPVHVSGQGPRRFRPGLPVARRDPQGDRRAAPRPRHLVDPPDRLEDFPALGRIGEVVRPGQNDDEVEGWWLCAAVAAVLRGGAVEKSPQAGVGEQGGGRPSRKAPPADVGGASSRSRSLPECLAQVLPVRKEGRFRRRRSRRQAVPETKDPFRGSEPAGSTSTSRGLRDHGAGYEFRVSARGKKHQERNGEGGKGKDRGVERTRDCRRCCCSVLLSQLVR